MDDGSGGEIRIMATDDERIKSFGEIFTNDSSRKILQLLFGGHMSAAQIAASTGISLQLVRYHLGKLIDAGVVKISAVEMNSKSQEMKMYTAPRFSVVIVPPEVSERAKKSRMLARSFQHIYRVVGLGAAAGVSGILSLLELDARAPAAGPDGAQDAPSQEPVAVSEAEQTLDGAQDAPSQEPVTVPEAEQTLDSTQGELSQEPVAVASEAEQTLDGAQDELSQEPVAVPEAKQALDGAQDAPSQESVTVPEAEPALDGAYELVINSGPSDLFLPLAALACALAGLAAYQAWRLRQI